MNRLLGMYVHTHWSYNNPYAARTWSLDQWKGYLSGLKGLGYNLVQIWPMLDTMPVPPTQSDREHLDKLAKAIEYAHKQGMTVYVGICANTAPNEKASSFTFQDRRYFDTLTLINPADKPAMDREMERRRALLEPLAEADGLWIIDSDPGGYKGSPVSEFVEIFGRHRELLDSIGRNIKLIYWMWAGWVDKHRFDPEWIENAQSVWVEALEGLRKLNPEPWGIEAGMIGHLKTAEHVGLLDYVYAYPYGVLEQEPSYPFTNWDPDRIAGRIAAFTHYPHPHGIIGNCQTHCVQLPHTYVFSHFAMGGTTDNLDPISFGERLIPGAGEDLAEAWKSLSIHVKDPTFPRKVKTRLEKLIQTEMKTGDLGGLLFGDAKRYVNDLILQLDLWESVMELRRAQIIEMKHALSKAVASFENWTNRHGFIDHYHDKYFYEAAHPVYREALINMDTPEASKAAEMTDMGKSPDHGQLKRLLDAMEKAVV